MSTGTPRSKYRLDPHARFRVLDDEGIFVLQEAGEVLVVNEAAALIVERLRDGASLDEAVETITERYEVDPERARTDAHALVEALIEAGAVSRA